jgi:hypothetical protein
MDEKMISIATMVTLVSKNLPWVKFQEKKILRATIINKHTL